MLGHQCRLIPVNQILESREMRFVEGLRAADRHADAMQGEGMVVADCLEGAVRRSAGPHVVLGMHLEKTALSAVVEDRGKVLVFEARPRHADKRMSRKADTRCSRV